ncbi:hypothetical protein GCM10009821_20270 [Aeromicrobium halocynthiae]|uniref:ARG and Rhodanese-Phosphatase-superfamily-associated domain-containing protein n=1 Tax=Aeromicrobium halocynthiae TaxID=560557 RepID=A0ABP5HNB0_9ACTN
MQELHVGHGTTRGALTVFPIWGEHISAVAAADDLMVTEQPSGPTVGRLRVVNRAPHPVAVLEGQILEGGWQNRMVARSVVIDRFGAVDVDVVCIEEGRWGGGGAHRDGRRRGSLRIRAGLRVDGNRQDAVWSRVRGYEARRGATATCSFTAHDDRAGASIRPLIGGLAPLPGQIGVLIGLAGQPMSVDVFGNDALLRREFDSLIRSAAFDALDLPAVATPARRARRFLDRADRVTTRRTDAAGAGWSIEGRDEYVIASGLDHDSLPAHRALFNPRHELALAGA